MNRRDLLPSMMAGLAAVSPTLSAVAATSGKPHGSTGISEFMTLDPVENFRQAMRLQRSLEDADDILHWYHFIMVAVPLNATPKPVVRWEGIEFSRHQIMSENRYRMHGHNLSFPRDLKTGKFVSEVQNPVTGKMVLVPPMALTQDPGLIRSPAGVISLDKPSAPPRPDYKLLRRENGFVKVDGIRLPPDSWPATFLEMGTEAAPAQIFDDPSVKWLPTEVSGAYVFPWPAWMQMGNTPGHMFAAWSGCKLRSIDELPTEFRRRAEKDFPQLLSVDRRAFERPLPDLHTG
mgnify:FL=1